MITSKNRRQVQLVATIHSINKAIFSNNFSILHAVLIPTLELKKLELRIVYFEQKTSVVLQGFDFFRDS